MARYFLEVAYKGTAYSGFQVQENSNTIQAEIEKAFLTVQRIPVSLTGSSRTDAGVHALQNFFHLDFSEDLHHQLVYKMNSVLPKDIVIKGFQLMPDEAHARFDATSREYEYKIYQTKNPFLTDTALYYPYKLDIDLMNKAAELISTKTNFYAFSKTNTQVKSFNCIIYESKWIKKDGLFIYSIKGNRFLRGMVRLLTASMLMVGRHKWTVEDLAHLFESQVEKCRVSTSAHGLYLTAVNYPEDFAI